MRQQSGGVMSPRYVCLGNEWYSPENVRQFTKHRILWVISNLADIRQGNYPLNPEKRVELDVPTLRKGHRYYEAHWESIISIAVKLMVRLEKTGRDGAMVLLHYGMGIQYESLCKMFGLSYEAVRWRVHKVLKYCEGLERKKRSYRL